MFRFSGVELFPTLAIGTKVAPSYANMVMSIFEEKYVYTYILQTLLWLRFIDDIFEIWQHGLDSLLKFVDFLNTCVKTLKFTLEYSLTEISFLDVLVKIDEFGKITTDLYFKKKRMAVTT